MTDKVKLPFELQLPFFKVILENGCITQIENWIYDNEELANFLSDDDYLALISMDYHQKYTLLEISNIINPYLDYTTYYCEKLKSTLLELQENPNNVNALNVIYDFYCQGYSFLRKLALLFGLCVIDRDDLVFSDEAKNEIRQQAMWLYDDIFQEKIIIINKPSYEFDCDMHYYQDFRTPEQKLRTDLNQ